MSETIFGRVYLERLFTIDELDFLKDNPSIKYLAKSLLLIESKQGPDDGDWKQEERYEGIYDCLETHSNDLESYVEYVYDLLENFQQLKEIAFSEKSGQIINLYQGIKVEEVKQQFLQFLFHLEPYLKKIATIFIQIKELNDELLYTFFNSQTWGSTWSTELYIPKQYFVEQNIIALNKLSVERVLKFKLYNDGYKLHESITHDYEEELYNKLDEKYDTYTYNEIDYYLINTRIIQNIVGYIKGIIEKFRDSCRKILLEINKYKKNNKSYGDVSLKSIKLKIYEKYCKEYELNKLFSNIQYKKAFNKMLDVLYDYKKEVEESEYTVTYKYRKEKEFKKHIFHYLNRTRKMNLTPLKEVELAKSKIDILIDNNILLELKLSKTPINILDLEKYHNQLKETMNNWSSKIGFLIMLDVSDQKMPFASRENYFEPYIIRGGRGIDETQDKHPIGIITLLIFGGKRKSASTM